jgi:hypothetical protein
MAWRGHWSQRVNKNRANGLRHGFRSGLEERNARHLEAHGQAVLYEQRRIKYTIPAKVHTYTPDFELHNGILVETKGMWETKDRAKLLYIKTQYPDLDLRLLFSRASNTIYKGSPTTYGDWATAHEFKWAEKLIPIEWFAEPGPERSLEDILSSPLYDLADNRSR